MKKDRKIQINRGIDMMLNPASSYKVNGITLTEQGLAVTPRQLVNSVLSGNQTNQSPYSDGDYQEDNSFLAEEKDLATAMEQVKIEQKRQKAITKAFEELSNSSETNEENVLN